MKTLVFEFEVSDSWLEQGIYGPEEAFFIRTIVHVGKACNYARLIGYGNKDERLCKEDDE